MEKEKLKQGLSIQEIENLGRKYRFELFFILYFIVSAIFAGMIFSLFVSVCLAALGGIAGVFLPKKADGLLRGVFGFVFKQERVTKIVLAVAGLVIAFFLPPLVFFILGFVGGSNIYNIARSSFGG